MCTHMTLVRSSSSPPAIACFFHQWCKSNHVSCGCVHDFSISAQKQHMQNPTTWKQGKQSNMCRMCFKSSNHSKQHTSNQSNVCLCASNALRRTCQHVTTNNQCCGCGEEDAQFYLMRGASNGPAHPMDRRIEWSGASNGAAQISI